MINRNRKLIDRRYSHVRRLLCRSRLHNGRHSDSLSHHHRSSAPGLQFRIEATHGQCQPGLAVMANASPDNGGSHNRNSRSTCNPHRVVVTGRWNRKRQAAQQVPPMSGSRHRLTGRWRHTTVYQAAVSVRRPIPMVVLTRGITGQAYTLCQARSMPLAGRVTGN